MICRAWAIRSGPKRTEVRTTRQTVNVGMTSSVFGSGWRKYSLRSLSRSGWYCPVQNKNPARPNHTDFMACDYNIEIAIRDSNAFDGLGQDQCRKRQHIIGANTFCLVLTAARTLWVIAHVERGTEVPLCRYRPWYRQKVAPSQLDVAEACREALQEAGIFPIPRFIPELAENQEELDNVLPLAA